MSYNVFFRPTKAFRSAIEDPSIGKALLIVIVTSILLSFIVYMVNANPISAGVIALLNIAQWFVISALLWFFGLIFVRKKRHLIDKEFMGMATVTGKLWLLNLSSAILFIIALVSQNVIVISIIVVLLFILGIMLVVDSFKMIRVTLEIETIKTIIPWILFIVLYLLIVIFASLATNALLAVA